MQAVDLTTAAEVAEVQASSSAAATEFDPIIPTAATPDPAPVTPEEAPIADNIDDNTAHNTEEAESRSQIPPDEVRHCLMHVASLPTNRPVCPTEMNAFGCPVTCVQVAAVLPCSPLPLHGFHSGKPCTWAPQQPRCF